MAGYPLVWRNPTPGGILLPADLPAVRTTRMEVTALRRVNRRGGFPFQSGELSACLRVRYGGGGHESPRVGVQRIVEQAVTLALLDDTTEVHDGHTLTEVADHR